MFAFQKMFGQTLPCHGYYYLISLLWQITECQNLKSNYWGQTTNFCLTSKCLQIVNNLIININHFYFTNHATELGQKSGAGPLCV